MSQYFKLRKPSTGTPWEVATVWSGPSSDGTGTPPRPGL